jgi:hypothetical protein
MRVLLVGGLLGCHSAAVAIPDGSMSESGLHVSWVSKPTLPGSVGDITVDRATLSVQNLRVIGDAGDSTTTQPQTKLDWSSTASPSTIDFPEASPGLYSRIALELDGDLIDNSYDITGSVLVSGTTHSYEISDRAESTVAINIDEDLLADSDVNVVIQLDIFSALAVINFATLKANDAGSLELDTDDDQMTAFRTQLVSSFTLDNTTEDRKRRR